MGGLQGPDSLLEPIDQRQIISSAPKQGLAKVDVSLYETRQHGTTPGIDDLIGNRLAAARRDNATVANVQITAEDRAMRVHGQKNSALDKNRISHTITPGSALFAADHNNSVSSADYALRSEACKGTIMRPACGAERLSLGP
jgi:hypothetical protein